MNRPNEYPPQQEQPFLTHLIELRDRLLRVVLVVLLVFLSLFYFANDLYTLLAEPLLRYMPQGGSMIATEVASPFLTPFKLTLVLSVFISIPFILYQAWGFIAPALYQNEKRLVFPLLISSTALFYLGMVFAYFVVFPLVFRFFTGVAPQGVAVMTDISRYLDFVLKLFFAFGVAFEVPIATILVIWSGLTTREALAAKRPYIIVVAFVVGMLLTPPDVISQTLLALPMWALFELGLLMSKFYTRQASEEDDQEQDNDAKATPAAGNVGAAATDPGSVASAYPSAEDEGDYWPMSEAEMDAELDRIEAEEAQEEAQEEARHEEYEPLPDTEADTEAESPEDREPPQTDGDEDKHQ
jgi:sec-independent protein translocase protein TatC